jgi:hypothetical protein
MPENKLDLVQFPAGRVAKPGGAAAKIMRRKRSYAGSLSHTSERRAKQLFSDAGTPSFARLVALRNTLPLLMFAARVHSSITVLTQSGTGTGTIRV